MKEKKELEQLKQNKDVLRYIALSKYESMSVKSDGELIYETFKEIGEKTKNSQKIYVFMGSYLHDYSLYNSDTGKALTHKNLSTIKNASWIKYNNYWDLETIEIVRVARKDIAEFEKIILSYIVMTLKFHLPQENIKIFSLNYKKNIINYLQQLLKKKLLLKSKNVINYLN